MVNKTKYYKLPTGQVTTNVDEYIDSWRQISDPICNAFGMEVVGFDPGIAFRKGSPYSAQAAYFDMPLWFAKILSATLQSNADRHNNTAGVLMAVQEQFRIHGNNFPDEFDTRVFNWVDDTLAGTPPNLRG